MGFNGTATSGVIILTIGSLYVATLCNSSIGALVIAAPVMFVVAAVGFSYFAPAILGGAQSWPLKLAIVLLLALALGFGHRNYVSASREPGRVGWQVGSMVVILLIAGSMYYGAQVSY